MGTGFSVDSPVKVAPFGISSVISIVDDDLIEKIRKFHCEKNQLEYQPIKKSSPDFRAERITAYLNMVKELVDRQIQDMKSSPLDPKGKNGRFFQMLPPGELKELYSRWKGMDPGAEKDQLESQLKEHIRPGSIDVNIMTKLDGDRSIHSEEKPSYYTDAVAALRGYALSDVASSVIFSAGMNPRLYSSIVEYSDFFVQEDKAPKKKIILKVSDYRSALIQGQMLARKGIWVSEFRIESGLNCGGHAFATKGSLMGPILQEFHDNRNKLQQALFEALQKSGQAESLSEPLPMNITVQGGIGTSMESDFLLDYYQLDSVGWGTPFMLVPEATNLDQEHLDKLIKADEKQVFLSQASPLGVLFWNIKDSASEIMRRLRIRKGKPGASCKRGFLALNQELTEKPVCTASSLYQKLKIKELEEQNLEPSLFQKLKERVLAKSCLCLDLGSSATKMVGIDPKGHTALTPGPNIVNFSKISSLKDMVSHIYGKINLVSNPDRPHVFIRELELYYDYIKKEIENRKLGINSLKQKYFGDFQKNLLSGVEYYSELSSHLLADKQKQFMKSLEKLKAGIQGLSAQIESI